VLSSAPYFYSTGRNRDYIALADQQHPLDPAHLSGLWATKGIAHYNRGEIGLAVAALRQARTLSEGIEVNHRVLVGGGDLRVVMQFYFSRALTLIGFFDELTETTERFLQTVGRIERPFDIAWTLLVEGNLCDLFGNNDKLLIIATKVIEICKRHGYGARRGNGLILRGIARSRMGELDAGILDLSEGVAIWRRQGVVFHLYDRTSRLCDSLVLADRLDEASRLLDDVDAIVTGTDESGFRAECLRIRGQIAACRGDLPEAIRQFEEAVAISQQREARLSELRATTQLAAALAREGRFQEGDARLSAIITAFDTNHAIYDLAAARKSLTALRR
jgi:tetratricopeptide (TPR) repeat protein